MSFKWRIFGDVFLWCHWNDVISDFFLEVLLCHNQFEKLQIRQQHATSGQQNDKKIKNKKQNNPIFYKYSFTYLSVTKLDNFWEEMILGWYYTHKISKNLKLLIFLKLWPGAKEVARGEEEFSFLTQWFNYVILTEIWTKNKLKMCNFWKSCKIRREKAIKVSPPDFRWSTGFYS